MFRDSLVVALFAVGYLLLLVLGYRLLCFLFALGFVGCVLVWGLLVLGLIWLYSWFALALCLGAFGVFGFGFVLIFPVLG